MIRKTHISTWLLLAILAVACVTGFAQRAEAQSYERMRATKLVLSGSGPDLSHTITFIAPSLTSSSILSWPAANALGILTNDGLGNLNWGTLGTNSITPGADNNFLVTDGSGNVLWDAFSIDATLSGNGIGTPLGIDLANPNTWIGAQTMAPTTNVPGLVVQGTSAGTPTADIFDVQSSGGLTTDLSVDKNGLTTAGNGMSIDTSLNVNGYLSLQNDFTAVQGTATTNDVNPGTETVVGISTYGTAGPDTITGFTGGTNGRELIIANLNTYNLILSPMTGSAVSNQIITTNGQSLILPPYAFVQLFWYSYANGWVVEFTSGINSVTLGNTGLSSVTQNGILFGNGTNPVGVTSAAANSVLVTDGSDNPSLSQTLPAAVQSNITSLTGMTGDIQYPTSLTFDGSANRLETLERNTGTNPGSRLTVQAGAPHASASSNNLNGGNLTLSSGVSEGTGVSSIIFQTPVAGSIGNSDNALTTQLTLNSTQLNLGAGIELDQNGTQRISPSGAGTLSSLTLGTPLTGTNGGTGSTLISFTTGGSTARTYTLPDANASLLSTTTGVELQSSTPGTTQNGNVNVAGILLADSIGIGTSSPTGGLDIEGTLVYGIDSVTIAGGSSNNNASPGLKSASSIGMSGTPGPATITGFSGGVKGRTVRIGNSTGQSITLSYMSALSSPGNQIYNATGQDFVLAPKAVATFSYITGLHAWGMGYVEGVPTPIAIGGTGATSAAAALTNLLPSSPTAGYFLEWNGSAFVWQSVSASPGVVTSVGIDPGTTGLTVSNSPITSSGNIGLAGTLAISHGGTGSTTQSAALNALLPDTTGEAGKVLKVIPGGGISWNADSIGGGTVTSVNVAIPGMTSSGPVTTSGTISMSGDLSVSNGGTGQGSALTPGGVVYGASTTAMATSVAGTSGQVLVSGGTGAPSFTSGLSGLTINNSTIGATTPSTGAFTSVTTPTVYGGTAAGSSLNLQSTSSGSPSGDYITMKVGGQEAVRMTTTGMGIGGVTPTATVDVNGTFAIVDDSTTIIGSASNDNVPMGTTSLLHIGESGTAGPSTITGFSGGGDGVMLTVVNLTGQNLTFANQSGSSLAANEIFTRTGASIVLSAGGVAQLRRDEDISGWAVEFIGGTNSTGTGGTGVTSFTFNGILYGSGSGPIQSTSAGANSVLVTNGGNVPSLSQTLPTQVQGNITALTGMTGMIEYPTGLIFNGTAGVGDSMNRNTGVSMGQNLTVRAGAPAVGVGNIAGGNLILSSGAAEGTGASSIMFQVPGPGSSGVADNVPVTQMSLNSTALNLAIGTNLQTNGTTRISSAGAGTLSSLTLGSPLTVPSGGTGLSTIPAHSVLIGEGTSSIAAAATSTAGYVLTSNGASSDPTWQASTGTVFSVSNSDGSLAIAPTTGNVVASLAPSHSNAWTAQQSFSNTTTAAAAAAISNTSIPSTGTALGATIASTGVSTGSAGNVALQLAASGSTGTGGNTALNVTAGNIKIASLSPSVPVFTDASKNLISTGTIPVGNGGTGTSTAFTLGSVIFAGAGGAYAQDNSNFFWDETNKTLTLGGSGYELPQSTVSTSGNINNFLQINNQNLSNGDDASTDFVATADNGSNSSNYVDMGINGSGFNQGSQDIVKPDDAYLYAQGGNLAVGSAATGDSLILFTGGQNTTNRAISIDGLQIITFSQYGAGALSTNGSGVISAGTLSVSNGGTGHATIAAHCVILGEGASAVAVATPSTAGYVLTSTGPTSDPTWQSASGAVLSVTNSDGTLTISPTTGNVIASLALGHANIWTGTQTFPLTDAQGSALANSINNATTTLLSGSKISGNISGNAANITGIVALANGGTNANLTASNGGIFYSTGSAGAILSGTATAHQVLLSGSSSAPAWSSVTFPTTTSANQLLYSNVANSVTGLTTANSGVLVTSSVGVPSISSSLPSGLTIPAPVFTGTLTLPAGSIGNAALANSSVTVTAGTGMSGGGTVALGGTITLTNAGVTSFSGGSTGLTPSIAATGAVSLAGLLGSTYGGTGVNNGLNTITLGGNMNTGGAFTTTPGNAVTFTTTGPTSITLPTSGTLATTSNTVSSVGLSLPSIFTVTNSPVTSSGTLTGTLTTETANTIFAGPTTGSAVAPTFRTLVSTDFPTNSINYGSIQNETKSTILGNPSASAAAAPSEITLGAGLSFSGTTLVNTGVTTNPLTTLGDIIYASNTATPATPARLGGNITASTKAFLSSTATAGGVAQAPAWAILASADIPNNTANTTGSAGSFTGSLAGDVTGTQGATAIANTSAAGGHIIAAMTTNTGTLTNNTSGNSATTTSIATTLTTSASPFYPTFVPSSITSTGQAADVATGLSYVPSTGTLSATTFSGALSGNATGFTGSLAGDVTGSQGATAINNTAAAGNHIVAALNDAIPTTPIDVAAGGSGIAARTIHSIQVGNGTSAITQLATGNPGQLLTSSGVSADPAWTTATYPSTTAINTLLYASSANIVATLPTANGGILNTSSAGVPSITTTPTLGVAGPSGATGSISFANSTNANLTTIQAGVATAAATYTLPTALPGITGLFLTSTTSGGMSWTSAITGAVNYNVTATQNTAAITGTNYLFDVGYASTASTNPALGGVVTSTNTAAGAGTIAQNSATGLTINANATGTGVTTGTATGLVVSVAGVGAADTILPNIILHTAIPSGLTGWGTTGDYSEIMTADSGLILKETGDMYGTSILELQNRTGSNGALFQTIPSTPGTNLVDYGFIPGTGVQSNIRLEARTAFLRGSQNQTAAVPEEFQYYFGTTTSNPQYVLSIGPAATMLEIGKFGIGYVSPTAGTAGGAGSPLEKLDVHSMGSFYGASNIMLSDSGTSTITAPNTGSLKFQGTNDGISSFTAGAQGSNYVNYTLPTVTTEPSANQVLAVSAISGSGTSASPYAAAMTWLTQGPSVITGGTTAAFSTISSRFFNPSGIMTTSTATSASLANGSYIIAPRSGIISKLYAEIATASGSGRSWTVTLTDGANTLSATLSNATIGNSGAGTLPVAAGDLISLSVVPSGNPTANTGAVWGFEIQ